MKLDQQKLYDQSNSSDEENSSSSEDDENAEFLTEEIEDGFFKVLSHLKKKGSKLYEEGIRFFPPNSVEGNMLDSDSGKSKKKTHKDYMEWLKGQKAQLKNEEVKKDLEALHDFWTSPTLNKDEKFLRDYILNKKFLESDGNFNLKEEINKLSDEEKEIEKELLFEHKYNYRFENANQEPSVKKKSKSKTKSNKGNEGSSVQESGEKVNNNIAQETNEEESPVETSKKKRTKKRKTYTDKSFDKIDKTNETANSPKDKSQNIKGRKESHQPESNSILAHEKELVKINEKERQRDQKKKNTKMEEIKNEKEQLKSLLISKNNQEDTTKNVLKDETCTKTVKHIEEKKLKRKRRRKKDFIHSKENLSSNKSIEVQSENLQQELKKKKKCFNIESKNTVEAKKLKNGLPRNLQSKNAVGKKKMRHRNMRKFQEQWVNKKFTLNSTKYSTSHHIVDVKHKQQQNNDVSFKKKFHGDSKANKLKNKKFKHFHNLIVKEKKNKQKKLSKIHSKKQKAANVVGRR